MKFYGPILKTFFLWKSNISVEKAETSHTNLIFCFRKSGSVNIILQDID